METLLGHTVFDGDLDACVASIVRSIDAREPCATLACLNPHSYVVAKHDAQFRMALQAATWLVPDGAGVVLASRWLGGRIRKRMTGPDVFQRLHQRLAERGSYRVFLLGASERTLERMVARLAAEHPHLIVAGILSPPYVEQFDADQSAAMIRAINAARPDLLWVAMTAPKQEKWLQAHRVALDVPFAGAVGAAFDFYAGTVRRSSPWFGQRGLEWLPRLVRNPARLWRRTFVSAPLFLADVVRARWRR